MAARRITKSAIDWVAFAERVPESQRSYYLAFKAKSDNYMRKAFTHPENPPVINWAYYRTRISPSLVEQFEKQFTALKVPYPTENTTLEIEAQQREAEKATVAFVKASNERIEKHKKELARWDDIMPFDQMTMEDFHDAFPEYALDPINRPTPFPHDEEGSHLLGPGADVKKE